MSITGTIFHYMLARQSLEREKVTALSERLTEEVGRCANEAPATYLNGWRLALSEAMETALARLENGDDSAFVTAYLCAFVRELAFELALFTERRDVEPVGATLEAVVIDELSRAAIAA